MTQNQSLYFFITYSLKQKENQKEIKFVVPKENELKPSNIYQEEIIKSPYYIYNKIFKVSKAANKGHKKNNYFFEFHIDEEKYLISFDSKGSTFIYDVSLEVGKRILDITTPIRQNKDYYQKMECFIKALKDEGVFNEFFAETIKIYSIKKGFTFLIMLFLEIYQKINDLKKDIFPNLLEVFKKINENPKDNAKNMDRNHLLKKQISKFLSIQSSANKIIEQNNLNFIEFYGILLSYFNYYDYENFMKIVNELYEEKNKRNYLFEIMLIYDTHFFNKINIQNNDFYDMFIKYSIDKDFTIFSKGLNYIPNIETYIEIIEVNKKKIYEKYNADKLKKIIKLDKLKFKQPFKEPNEVDNNYKNRYMGINEVINKIKSIIDFCNDNNTFLIYFTNNFWQYTLNYYNEPEQDNIFICFDLRNTFKKYYKLVNKIFKKDEASPIKKEAKIYFERDEFAIILDQLSKNYNNNPKKEMTNMEKLNLIIKYNPYYSEPSYSKNVDCSIFDSFDLNTDNQFDKFRQMEFESIFKDNIFDYIRKFMDKIKTISNIDAVIKLINIKNIVDKDLFLSQLNIKYDNIICNEIGLLKDNDLKEAIYIVAEIAIINYNYQQKENRFDFINKRISDLDKRIIPSIFIEIMNICFDVNEDENENDNDSQLEEYKIKFINEEFRNFDYNDLKKTIYNKYLESLKNEDDIGNIIEFLDYLEKIDTKNKEDKLFNDFLNKLISENKFTKEEFFGGNKNIKILLLYNLYKKYKDYEQLKKKKIYDIIKNHYEVILDDIQKDIDNGYIKKNRLEDFLNNEEHLVKQKLELIKIIITEYNEVEKYEKLKKTNDEINKNIEILKKIKNNIIIYYKEKYKKEIQKIKEGVEKSKNKQIREFNERGNIGDLIKETETKDLRVTSDKIEVVKDFLLFNIIYDMNPATNEDEKFNSSYKELDKISQILIEQNKTEEQIITKLGNDYSDCFKKIKEILCMNEKDEDEAKKFIEKFRNYYEIKNNKLIEEITIFIKSKKYELDIKSIIFFFEYKFEKNNEKWNKMIHQNDDFKGWEDFQSIINYLNKLKGNGIYDYTNIEKYNNLFTCLYNKKMAIDFLFSSTSEEIMKLKNKVQPTDRTIKIKDITDTENCVFFFSKMKKEQSNFKILDYVKTLEPTDIEKFENYSNKYASIIELDIDEEISDNLYDKVDKIITDATFDILQDNEDFNYINKETSKNEKITMNDLIHLKNQIQLNNEIENTEDEIKYKCKILLFFKDTISKLEIIIAYMNILRKKGNSLPIEIQIKINIINHEPKIKYRLGKYNKEFEEIKEFLFDAKNAYISQLDSMYKEKLNLRFLYGKQFRSITKHIVNNFKIDSFLRYILNNRNNNISIEEGNKFIKMTVNDFINYKQYIIYDRDTLEGISNYITSLFNNNQNNGIKTVEDHYRRMKIGKTGFNGLYLYKCEKDSMEKFIINLYLDFIQELPIAQNILITNEETTSEEIQSFFHRAILCNYNTLFVVQINDSFSDFQQGIMNNFIDILLSYKTNEYNTINKANIDKSSFEKYINSYIVFVYEKKNKNILPFLKEMEKYINKREEECDGCDSKLKEIENNEVNYKEKYYEHFKNILVINSSVCGLGKSELIRKITKDKNYFHFPLGGVLTKSIIYDKLNKLMNEIANEMKKNNLKYEDIAIHLDLTESKEKSILNEFFFSFLITRFYTNNENIIYIPIDFHIYIEIPNCFDEYLSNFSILNIFKKETITFENMPPFDYPNDIQQHFKNMLDLKSNEDIENYVKKKLEVKIQIQNILFIK